MTHRCADHYSRDEKSKDLFAGRSIVSFSLSGVLDLALDPDGERLAFLQRTGMLELVELAAIAREPHEPAVTPEPDQAPSATEELAPLPSSHCSPGPCVPSSIAARHRPSSPPSCRP